MLVAGILVAEFWLHKFVRREGVAFATPRLSALGLLLELGEDSEAWSCLQLPGAVVTRAWALRLPVREVLGWGVELSTLRCLLCSWLRMRCVGEDLAVAEFGLVCVPSCRREVV